MTLPVLLYKSITMIVKIYKYLTLRNSKYLNHHNQRLCKFLCHFTLFLCKNSSKCVVYLNGIFRIFVTNSVF